MKIAILGTRGIPNNYGGFEQCAEKIAERWAKQGIDVTVYNTDEHIYKKNEWKGIKIKHIFCKEKKIGIWGTFIYDYLCLKDAVKSNYDVILNLGYVPSALFFSIKKKTKAIFVTNMDGFEWKRKKWNSFLKKFILYCEKRAIAYSDLIVCDNLALKNYYLKFLINNKKIEYISYGAEIPNKINEQDLKEFGLKEYGYYLSIARIEPENNIDTILEAYIMSKVKDPFIVIGNLNTKHAKYLIQKYKIYKNIIFLGPLYNYKKLSVLRKYAKLYFHGYTVGGTNPSLLEAMASGAYIVAHDNEFNKAVLSDNGLYFKNKLDLKKIFENYDENLRKKFSKNNIEKIKKDFNWDLVAYKYIKVFKDLLNKKND